MTWGRQAGLNFPHRINVVMRVCADANTLY